MAVVRGPFFGFVVDGPYGAGTWGGPTKAGAWVVHAGLSVPIVFGLVFALHGIRWLHVGLHRRWVLLATIAVCASGLLLIWSWVQQL
ncbi:hypothetical protein [Kribbella sp. CA-247076]|uniref:hypothetical protein n=1 Tax=Kribbella sp. CA-247076 TaxID=3239941 RepID=UPI003D90DF83